MIHTPVTGTLSGTQRFTPTSKPLERLSGPVRSLLTGKLTSSLQLRSRLRPYTSGASSLSRSRDPIFKNQQRQFQKKQSEGRWVEAEQEGRDRAETTPSAAPDRHARARAACAHRAGADVCCFPYAVLPPPTHAPLTPAPHTLLLALCALSPDTTRHHARCTGEARTLALCEGPLWARKTSAATTCSVARAEVSRATRARGCFSPRRPSTSTRRGHRAPAPAHVAPSTVCLCRRAVPATRIGVPQRARGYMKSQSTPSKGQRPVG